MKLAEALSIRSQLVNKITQLRSRLNDCVKIQEGDDMAETPMEVVEELDSTLGELRRIIYAINMTNTLTKYEDGRNLTSLIAERDTLKQRVSILNSAVETLTQKESRYNRSEIRYVRTVDVPEFRKLYNESAAKLRKLDLQIQGLGFTTDLIEE
ncbi:MAG: DIP1984 family protein [Muribaculaceae bacterium]|nr:DIP1984 family protein [Muribaculaceae bacterium]MDE7419253.1 DIP1984 family protein [Muribaculaceae bacterium]